MEHLHIISDGEDVGKIWVDHNEKVHADTKTAQSFLDHVISHPKYHHLQGRDLLNAVEDRLDRDSRVGTKRHHN